MICWASMPGKPLQLSAKESVVTAGNSFSRQDVREKNLSRKEEKPMRYEKPELKEIGEADELIQVILASPDDYEPSTQRLGFVDPAFGLDSDE